MPCGYVTVDQHTELTSLSAEVGKMMGSMIRNPGGFLICWPLISVSSS